MERALNIKDILDFDDIFNRLKMKILEKQVKGKLITVDFVSTFLMLNTTID